MSCDASKLSVLAYANGFTWWHYATKDTYNDVRQPDYFDDAKDMLRHGDKITAETNDRGFLLDLAVSIKDTSITAMAMPAELQIDMEK